MRRKILINLKCLEMFYKLPKGKHVISTLYKSAGITIAKNMLACSIVRTTECVTQSSLFVRGGGVLGQRMVSWSLLTCYIFEVICLEETEIELLILHRT